MVRRVCDRSFNAKLVEEFDELDVIRASVLQENEDQATRKFLRREYARLVETTEEQSEKLDSMAAMMRELQQTLSQLNNQLGIPPIEAETSRQTPTMSFIEFPIFTGVDGELRQWISWLEDFFVRERFTEDEKMNLAQSLLEGKAEVWFYRTQKILLFRSWEDLKNNLLLWFGDFADSDRLIVAHDRFLKEIRVEAKRMETTSLNLQESIPNQQKIVEESSENVAENWDEKASEKKSIHQYQVPVSSLEPGLSFSNESLVVSEARPSDIVSTNRLQSQSGFECVKNMNNAHHVFDELSRRRHKCQQRKKLSLSPKSRMFKFKNRTLLSNWSQRDLHQVIDISKVNTLSLCFSATFGLVRKKRTFQCLRLQKQAHMSRVLYPMRMLHDPGGMKRLLHGDMKPMAVKPMGLENQTPAASVNSLSFEVVTGENMFRGLSQTSQVWEPGGVLADHVLVDWLMDSNGYDGIVAGISCLDIGVYKIDLLWVRRKDLDELCVGQEKSIMRRKGASNSWCRWMVFDRGKNNIISGDVITLVFLTLKKCFFQEAETRAVHTMLLEKAKDAHVDSLIVRIKVILSCGVAWEKQIQWAEIQKLSLYKELWIEIMDGDITKLLKSNGGKLRSYGYVLEVTFLRGKRVHRQQQKKKSNKAWRFKYKSSLRNTRSESREMKPFVGVDAQKEDGGGGSSSGTADIKPDPGIDTFPFSATANLGENVHMLPAAEQRSSSIWHRWRRKYCTRTRSIDQHHQGLFVFFLVG